MSIRETAKRKPSHCDLSAMPLTATATATAETFPTAAASKAAR